MAHLLAKLVLFSWKLVRIIPLCYTVLYYVY